MGRAISGPHTTHLKEHVVDTPEGGRTTANWHQKQRSRNPEKKRDAGGAGRKDSDNSNRVGRSAGARSGLGRSRQEQGLRRRSGK
eukprot:3001569-Pyramimonas_sp.AAC.2